MLRTVRGYMPDFMGVQLKLPEVPNSACAPLKSGTGKEIKYLHYSSFLHKNRKLPLLCATNIKGEGYNAPERGTDVWNSSEQVLARYQLDNSFYGNDGNTFDRGHIVRRVDTCWGGDDIVDDAEKETFMWTNCTPQHKKLNQQGGVWFELEQHVMENGVKNKIADISVFAGPVLDENDKYFKVPTGKLKEALIQIPTEFWKIIVWKKSNGNLYAVGFLMSQWEFIKRKVIDKPSAAAAKEPLPDSYFENLKFKDHQTYQVPISVIQEKTGIKFDWANVNFPYKARRARTVQATPLKNKITFGSIYNKMKRIRATTGLPTNSKAAIRAVHAEEKPLSKAQIARAVRQGFQGAIKQYTLTNIKL